MSNQSDQNHSVVIQLTPAYFLPEQLKPGARTEWVLAKGIFLGIASGSTRNQSSYAEETKMWELIPLWKPSCWRTGCSQYVLSAHSMGVGWNLCKIQQCQQQTSLLPGSAVFIYLCNPLDPLHPFQSRKKLHLVQNQLNRQGNPSLRRETFLVGLSLFLIHPKIFSNIISGFH